jgi:hypothetical protein
LVWAIQLAADRWSLGVPGIGSREPCGDWMIQCRSRRTIFQPSASSFRTWVPIVLSREYRIGALLVEARGDCLGVRDDDFEQVGAGHLDLAAVAEQHRHHDRVGGGRLGGEHRREDVLRIRLGRQVLDGARVVGDGDGAAVVECGQNGGRLAQCDAVHASSVVDWRQPIGVPPWA